jgi:hypothetical protein
MGEINLNTLNRLVILINMSYLNHFQGTQHELEMELGLSSGHPEAREIFKLLRQMEIMYPTDKKYGYQLYKIDIKKLCILIEEQEFIKYVAKYLDFIH